MNLLAESAPNLRVNWSFLATLRLYARATLPATPPVGQRSNSNPKWLAFEFWATQLGLGFRIYSRQSRQWIFSLVELHVLSKVSRCPCIAPPCLSHIFPESIVTYFLDFIVIVFKFSASSGWTSRSCFSFIHEGSRDFASKRGILSRVKGLGAHKAQG